MHEGGESWVAFGRWLVTEESSDQFFVFRDAARVITEFEYRNHSIAIRSRFALI